MEGNMVHWAWDSIFYHIYPLGYCEAPERNDFASLPVNRLAAISKRLDSIQALGADAIYLGPVFESLAHGYDTVDYRRVDRRLGSNEDLRSLAAEIHGRGMRLLLDGVFNHVGREHPWFRSLREEGRGSSERRRFASLDFGHPGREARSPAGDPFSYEGWNGHYDLARLDLKLRDTREELIGAALSWIEDYEIDGLRLDTADCLEPLFLAELSAACRARKPGFWLLGEVVHGDYRNWAAPGLLDSTTNYECWKGLWSSLKDRNYFEIAYALNRQFGPEGIYRGLPLYAFADNHDVDRAASLLPEPALLYPLYCLLFTMPGVPSIYYGSERGIEGRKEARTDRALRPSAAEAEAAPGQADLAPAISRLAALRRALPALRRGAYRELAVTPRQLAFGRACEEGCAIVALNADFRSARLEIPAGSFGGGFVDALNGGQGFAVRGGKLVLELPPTWARVLVPA
jgi:cyclomaltodextrinase